MTFPLFLAAMAFIAIMSTSASDRAAARQKANERWRWLYIPSALIFLALLWPG